MADVQVSEENNQEAFHQMVQTIQYLQNSQTMAAQTILDSGAMVNSGCSKKSKMENVTPLSAPVEVLGSLVKIIGHIRDILGTY